MLERMQESKKTIKGRFLNKQGCEEFLFPILSGSILRTFDDSKQYVSFDGYILSDNFEHGHEQYFQKWRHLFLHEAYCFMMNSRYSKFTGSDIELKNQIFRAQKEKTTCWKGYFIYKGQEGRFATLKMMKEPPNISYTQRTKNFSKIYDEPERKEGESFELSHCREEDLIIISKFRINLEGQDDIKMVSGGVRFLKGVLNKNGVIFGMIRKSNTKTDNFVEVLIDDKYSKGFQGGETDENGNVFTRYCYYFDSLLTSMREFKALKNLEFTRLCPAVTFPSLFLEDKDKMIEDYSEIIESSFDDLDNGPTLFPTEYAGDYEKAVDQMNYYLIQNHKYFNKSQARVLE